MRKFKLSKINKKIMLSKNRDVIQDRFDALNEKREAVTDEQRRQAIIASSKDEQEAAAFAAAREERINAYLWAKNYALGFFEYVPLAQDEWPEIVNISDQNYNILETNAHGEAPVQNWANADTVTRYNPVRLTSGIVKYPIISAYTGRIDVSDEVDKQAARSMDTQLNTDAYTLIDAAIGTYPASAIVEDSRIVSGTLPSTNSLSFTAQGAFTFQILKEIVDHFLRLGKSLSAIVINPTEMRDTWDWQHLVSTTSSGSQDGRTMITTRVKDEILQSGQPGSLLGQEFTWILDPIRALKSATFFSTEPAGTLYDKEDLAKVTYFNAKEMKLAKFGDNFNGVEMEKWVKLLIKAPQRLNFGKITFTT